MELSIEPISQVILHPNYVPNSYRGKNNLKKMNELKNLELQNLAISDNEFKANLKEFIFRNVDLFSIATSLCTKVV